MLSETKLISSGILRLSRTVDDKGLPPGGLLDC